MANKKTWMESLELQYDLQSDSFRKNEYSQIYHGFVLSEGHLAEVYRTHRPAIYASGNQVLEVITYPLSGSVFGTDFFFTDDDKSEAADVLDSFKQQIHPLRSILRRFPKKCIPEFRVPPLSNGLNESLVYWTKVMHWLTSIGGHLGYRQEVEFCYKVKDISSRDPFGRCREDCVQSWDIFSGLPEFEVENLINLTYKPSDDWEAWRDRHREKDRYFPQVIAASLTKALTYASLNAVARLQHLGAEEASANSRRIPFGRKIPGLSMRGYQLYLFLREHHKPGTTHQNDQPAGTQSQIATALSKLATSAESWQQCTVSKAFVELLAFALGAKEPPRNSYNKLCEQGLIHFYLLNVEKKITERAFKGKTNLDMDKFSSHDARRTIRRRTKPINNEYSS